MRYGTRTECKRRWSRQGKRPCCKVKLGYQWGYLYVAINPFKADLFAMYYSHLDKDCFTHYEQMLRKHVDKQYEDKNILLIGDRATAHTTAKHIDKIEFAPLPTACPELNPVERFFQELRRKLANQVFENTQQVEKVITQALQWWNDNPDKLSKLTLFSFYKI